MRCICQGSSCKHWRFAYWPWSVDCEFWYPHDYQCTCDKTSMLASETTFFLKLTVFVYKRTFNKFNDAWKDSLEDSIVLLFNWKKPTCIFVNWKHCYFNVEKITFIHVVALHCRIIYGWQKFTVNNTISYTDILLSCLQALKGSLKVWLQREPGVCPRRKMHNRHVFSGEMRGKRPYCFLSILCSILL